MWLTKIPPFLFARVLPSNIFKAYLQDHNLIIYLSGHQLKLWTLSAEWWYYFFKKYLICLLFSISILWNRKNPLKSQNPFKKIHETRTKSRGIQSTMWKVVSTDVIFPHLSSFLFLCSALSCLLCFLIFLIFFFFLTPAFSSLYLCSQTFYFPLPSSINFYDLFQLLIYNY